MNKTNIIIGVDIGGTNLKAGLVDGGTGQSKARLSQRLLDKDPHAVSVQLYQLANDLLGTQTLTWADITSVGICTPGQVDRASGVVIAASNFPSWDHVPLAEYVTMLCHKPVHLMNDADAGGLAETLFGFGRDNRQASIAIVTLGTGVGLSLVLSGKLWEGVHSRVEGGHSIVDSSPQANPCSCGQRGCLEAYASATAIVQQAQSSALLAQQQQQHRQADAVTVQKNGQRDKSITTTTTTTTTTAAVGATVTSPVEVFEAAARGEVWAEVIVESCVKALAVACLNISRIVDVQAVLLAGGMAGAPGLIDRLRNKVKEITWTVFADNGCYIGLATCGRDGVLGAAACAAAAEGNMNGGVSRLHDDDSVKKALAVESDHCCRMTCETSWIVANASIRSSKPLFVLEDNEEEQQHRTGGEKAAAVTGRRSKGTAAAAAAAIASSDKLRFSFWGDRLQRKKQTWLPAGVAAAAVVVVAVVTRLAIASARNRRRL